MPGVAAVTAVLVVAGSEMTARPPVVAPLAVARLSTVPASTSACVITYGAVAAHSVAASGARVVAAQVTAPAFGSATATPRRSRPPVFVTMKVYAMVSPTPMVPLPSTSTGVPARFTRASATGVPTGVSTVSDGEVTDVPVGELPVARAVFVTLPASSSAAVTVYDAVQVVLAPGSSVVTGQATEPVILLSATATAVIVVVPVLVTRNV